MTDQPRDPLPESAMLMDPAFRLGWLEKQVHILEDKIRFLDELSFKIKGWAVTVWSGIVSLAIAQSSWRLACLSVATLFAFMLTDASYKRYQTCFVQRTRDIMRFLNEPAYHRVFDQQHPFPLYDLLNIHTKGQRHDPLAQNWGSILRPTLKASVALMYWTLFVATAFVIALLSFESR